jgi:predicted ATPase/DNA-binding SARP family transcriptional activator
MAVELGLLGPVLLRVDGAQIDVPGVRGQALLARLAIADGRAVPASELTRTLWPDSPDGSVAALHSQVHRVRRRLGPAAGVLRRSGTGYALDLDGHDAATARRLADAAGATLATDPAAAAGLAREALELWRGTALAEFVDLPVLAAEAEGLAELRLRLEETELEARLRLHDPGVVEGAGALARRERYREKPVLLQVAALAASGRAAEAMEVAAAHRRVLADETGLDPGPELAQLEREVAAGLLASDRRPGRRLLRRPSSPLVGRDDALAELAKLLDESAVVTVTGPGGVGKTRLAQEAAADLAGRDREVAVVRLARVTADRQVPVAVGAAIGLEPAPEHAAALADALADRALVLVLDNAEHLLGACRDLVTEVIEHCPSVSLLTTSRAPLDAPGEQVLRLAPLPVDDAVEAFVAHVRRRHRSFVVTEGQRPTLEHLVVRLDGLPLAIELAARQAAHVPLAELVPRLDHSLDAFEADRPSGDERQRSLRSTIEWSLRLLGDEERTLLLGLAPYVGGISVDALHWVAAETVPGAEPLRLLTRLTEASLLAVSGDLEGRYVLLETVRAHLLDVLRAAGAVDDVEDRFLRWAVFVAEQAGRLLAGPAEADGDRVLRAELANLDAAVSLARQHGDVDTPAAVLAAVDYDIVWRGLPEIGGWALDLADDPGLVGRPCEAAVLASASSGAWLRGELDRCDRLAARALALEPDQAWSLGSLAVTAMFRARYEDAIDLLERGAGHGALRHTWWATAGLAAAYAGDLDRAEALVAREVGRLGEAPRPTHAAYVRHVTGELAALRGAHDVAATELAAAVETSREVGATFVEGLAAVGLASAWAASGRTAAAAGGFSELLDRWQRAGSWTQLWTTARNAAALLADHGNAELALTVLEAADRSPRAAALSQRARREVEAVQTSAATAVGPARAAGARARASGLATASLLEEVRTALATLT